MPKAIFILLCSLGFFLIPLQIPAQENPAPNIDIDIENSAEVFLESYSDEFQENFFEALKQKGIENYDKSINFLLKCKQLDATNPVVDHELAKVYFENRQYPLAEEYAFTALKSEPKNLWYADTLVQILQKQGKSAENMVAELPFSNSEFEKNLASIYFRKENYETALAILKIMEQTAFTADLTSKVKDSIEKNETDILSSPMNTIQEENVPNALEIYEMRINALIHAASFITLQEVSEEALESYPSQAYFYYGQGYALNRRGKHKEAIETLETALDYLIDDDSLSNKIYQELADGYTALNEAIKANTYLRKIKPGL